MIVHDDRPRHTADQCAPNLCPFHNPSQHHMGRWMKIVRSSGLTERVCAHGVGHPDPDSVRYMVRLTGETSWGVHGCDGCCLDPNKGAVQVVGSG